MNVHECIDFINFGSTYNPITMCNYDGSKSSFPRVELRNTGLNTSSTGYCEESKKSKRRESLESERSSEKVKKSKEFLEKRSLEELDDMTRLELYEVQINNLQRIADSLTKRLSDFEGESKRQIEIQNMTIVQLRNAIVNDHSEFRRAIEILAKHSVSNRNKLKEHNQIFDEFQSFVKSYGNDKLEHYLNEKYLKHLNVMADKILAETEISPKEISNIVESLGLSEKENNSPPFSKNNDDEIPKDDEIPILEMDFEDVFILFSKENN